MSYSSLLGQNNFLPIGVNEQQKKDYMYALKISDLSFHITKRSEGICYNGWNIKFTNRSNNPTIIYNRNEQDVDNLEGIFFSNSEIIEVSYYARSTDKRRDWWNWRCDQHAIINIKRNRFQDLEKCRKHSVYTIGRHGGNEVRNKLSFYYEILPLHTLKTSDANSAKHLPIEIEIPLIGKEGFASDLYEFRYKEPGKDWKTLKESQYSRHSWYDYPHTIYTSASKIFGAKAESMIGKTIDFQIVSRDKDNGNVCSTSNIIPLIITKSAPFIGVIDIKNPLCYSNEPTATFTVKLGRKLLGDLQKYKTDKNNYLGETLKITIQRKDSSRAERPENLPEEESKTTEYFLQHDRI